MRSQFSAGSFGPCVVYIEVRYYRYPNPCPWRVQQHPLALEEHVLRFALLEDESPGALFRSLLEAVSRTVSIGMLFRSFVDGCDL
jgi:hypothetical protein